MLTSKLYFFYLPDLNEAVERLNVYGWLPDFIRRDGIKSAES